MTENQVRRKVLRRFYEPLLLLNALGQNLGKRIIAEAVIDTLSPNIQKLRRSFADGVAYICAHEKESKCVIAAVLEKTPQGITVWLAANETIGEKVVQLLEKVLSDIQRISELNDRFDRQREGERAKKEPTPRIIAFNKSRILTYYKQMAQDLAPMCLEIIRKGYEKSGASKATL